MPTFTISVNNKVLGTYVVKKNVISIGRSRSNTISIASKAVSRNHVRIELTRDGWSIVDLGSLNGTHVNDIRVTSAFLSEGDRVSLGAYAITFSPEPMQDLSQEEQHAAVPVDASDTSDTDVRVDVSPPPPPATDTAMPAQKNEPAPSREAPPTQPLKAERGQKAALHEQPVEEEIIDTEQPQLSVAETRGSQQAGVIEAMEWDREAVDRRKKERQAILNSKPSGLQLEDRIRLVIFENPLAEETDIRKRLAGSDFGGATIGRSELQSVLKKLDLETKMKRFRYFMHS